MAAVDSDGSDFGDDMALMPSMKAHTGGQGLGAASAPAAAVPLKKGLDVASYSIKTDAWVTQDQRQHACW